MARRNRGSQLKREREQKKRERKQQKAEKAAIRQQQRLEPTDDEAESPDLVPEESAEADSPSEPDPTRPGGE